MEFRVNEGSWQAVNNDWAPVHVFASLPVGTIVEYRYAAHGVVPASQIHSITIKSSDINQGTPGDDGDISINHAPVINNQMENQNIILGSGATGQDIEWSQESRAFTDSDGDTLTYTVTASNGAIVNVYIEDGSTVMFEALALGTTIITLTADDGNGGTTDMSFQVTVSDY